MRDTELSADETIEGSFLVMSLCYTSSSPPNAPTPISPEHTHMADTYVARSRKLITVIEIRHFSPLCSAMIGDFLPQSPQWYLFSLPTLPTSPVCLLVIRCLNIQVLKTSRKRTRSSRLRRSDTSSSRCRHHCDTVFVNWALLGSARCSERSTLSTIRLDNGVSVLIVCPGHRRVVRVRKSSRHGQDPNSSAYSETSIEGAKPTRPSGKATLRALSY